MITLHFTCGERKICSTIKKSQNIMNMILAQARQVIYKAVLKHVSDYAIIM